MLAQKFLFHFNLFKKIYALQNHLLKICLLRKHREIFISDRQGDSPIIYSLVVFFSDADQFYILCLLFVPSSKSP